MALTNEKLEKLKNVVLEMFPELTDVMIAVAEKAPNKQSIKDIAIIVKGSDIFREEILLFLAEKSKTAVVMKVPIEKIFPSTSKKDVN